MLISDLRRTKELMLMGELFDVLGSGKMKLKFKDEHWFMKRISPKHVSVVGNSVWVPSDDWLNDNVIATSVLAYHWAYIHQYKMLPLAGLFCLFSANFRATLRARAFCASLMTILYFFNGEYPLVIEDHILSVMHHSIFKDVLSQIVEMDRFYSLMPNVKRIWDNKYYSSHSKYELTTTLGIILTSSLKGLENAPTKIV